jgi:hypothetical protein
MRRWLLVAGILSGLGFGSHAVAQPNVEALTKGPYKYPIGPGAGAYVITLKGFKGQNAQVLAEEFAEYIRSSYGLPAYLLDFGSEMRKKEEERIAELRKQHAELVRQNGAENVAALRYKTHVMEPQFGVFIGGPKGGWKEDETPLAVLKKLREKPLPPEKFCDRVITATPRDAEGRANGEAKAGPISPFASGMISRNPTIPQPKNDENKPDPILKDLNAGEKYSLLKTSKPFTLVVRSYAGQTVVRERGADTSVLEKLMGGKSNNLLDASAKQAHELAKYLRAMKPSYDSYVLHTSYYSLVCVGNFDKPDDPQLMEIKRTLANLRIGNVEQLNADPLVMQIPRP